MLVDLPPFYAIYAGRARYLFTLVYVNCTLSLLRPEMSMTKPSIQRSTWPEARAVMGTLILFDNVR